MVTSKIINDIRPDTAMQYAEPSRAEQVRAIIPVKEINGLESKVYGHFGRAPYFSIFNIQQKKVQIEDFYLNEFLEQKKHIGLHVVKVLLNYDLDMLFTSRIGEISFSLLKENFIDIYRLENETLTIKQVIELYQQNGLARMTTPTHSVDESLSEIEEPITGN